MLVTKLTGINQLLISQRILLTSDGNHSPIRLIRSSINNTVKYIEVKMNLSVNE